MLSPCGEHGKKSSDCMVETSSPKSNVGEALDSSHRDAVASLPRGVAIGTHKAPTRLIWMLLASMALHLALAPIPALVGLLGMLPALQLSEHEELVEVELISMPMAESASQPSRPEQEEEPEDSAPDEPTAETEPESPPPSPEPDRTEPSNAPAPIATPSPEDESEKSISETYADPLALAGKAASIADQNAKVRLFLSTGVIREHALGPRVGALLRRTPQWRDFFGPSRIDPIEDVDRVLIAGPQIRNTSQMVAVVEHNLEPSRIESAFEGLVSRKGEWIDREARMARAVADRASRIFAAPNDELVVVAPPQLEQQLRSLGKETRFPSSTADIALTAYFLEPSTVAKGTGLRLPPSLKWVRLDLRPTEDGGGILQVLAQDESEETAQKNAAWAQRLVESVTTVDLRRGGGLGALASMLIGSQKMRMIQSVQFAAEGDQIEGRIIVTRNQLMNLADLVDVFLPPPPPESDPPPAPTVPSSQDKDVESPKIDSTHRDSSAPPALRESAKENQNQPQRDDARETEALAPRDGSRINEPKSSTPEVSPREAAPNADADGP